MKCSCFQHLMSRIVWHISDRLRCPGGPVKETAISFHSSSAVVCREEHRKALFILFNCGFWTKNGPLHKFDRISEVIVATAIYLKWVHPHIITIQSNNSVVDIIHIYTLFGCTGWRNITFCHFALKSSSLYCNRCSRCIMYRLRFSHSHLFQWYSNY